LRRSGHCVRPAISRRRSRSTAFSPFSAGS
jgi:hypothetical protein